MVGVGDHDGGVVVADGDGGAHVVVGGVDRSVGVGYPTPPVAGIERIVATEGAATTATSGVPSSPKPSPRPPRPRYFTRNTFRSGDVLPRDVCVSPVAPSSMELFIMAKQPAHHREPVPPAVVRQVRELARGNTPTRVIGIKTGRTPDAVYQIASKNGISLDPPNQSPYNRRK